MLTATLVAWFILGIASASAEPVRAAYPSANVQFLPAFEQRGVLHTRDNPEDAIQAMMKHLRLERDAALDAYQLICESLNPLPTEKGVELMA